MKMSRNRAAAAEAAEATTRTKQRTHDDPARETTHQSEPQRTDPHDDPAREATHRTGPQRADPHDDPAHEATHRTVESNMTPVTFISPIASSNTPVLDVARSPGLCGWKACGMCLNYQIWSRFWYQRKGHK